MSAVPPTIRETRPPLIECQGVADGVELQGIAGGVDGGAAGEQGHGEGGSAVVGQRGQAQAGEACQDDVAVGAAIDPALSRRGRSGRTRR